jgi:transposase
MLRQMECSTIHLLAKRGMSQRQIAHDLGRNRRTIARILQEPVAQEAAKRHFPFTQQMPATRYFLACRLKYSRWVWVRFTRDMRQETLFRGLVDCLVTLGWVPWVFVFDNMKTVTSGRDRVGQPVWTPAVLQLAAEMGFHPQACDPGAPNRSSNG